jgi:hypothetical protein
MPRWTPTCCHRTLYVVNRPNVYMLRTVDSLLLLVLYVDDLLIIGCSTSVIVAVKRILHDRFLMMRHGFATLIPWT